MCLDEDDAAKYDGLQSELPPNWRWSVKPRAASLGLMMNEYFWNERNASWYGGLADDSVPVTKHWDQKLVAAAGNDGISICVDGIANGTNLGAAFVMAGNFVRRLGWIIYPGLARVYGDNILYEIADRRGVLRYLEDVTVEHWHFSNGKSPMDETYRKDGTERDEAIYRAWKGAQP